MQNGLFFPAITDLRASGSGQEILHGRAALAARARFGKKVFVRAVVEVSNFCRENCAYCGMRRDNRSLDRYRAQLDHLAELIIHHRPKSITDINLQAGEDPVVVREVILPLLRLIREQTPLGISVCLGTLNANLYAEMKAEGASIYILKFEIGDPTFYEAMQAPGTFTERLEHVRMLAAQGWNVSSGFICGLPGETDGRLLQNFAVARNLPLTGCSVSPFIAGEETPLSENANGNIELTLNCMAALRLMRPDWIIPAVSALNLSEPKSGYRRGLSTGANLVTINMTPDRIRDNYLLYKRERFIMTEDRILSAISSEGLEPSGESLTEFYRSASAAKV